MRRFKMLRYALIVLTVLVLIGVVAVLYYMAHAGNPAATLGNVLAAAWPTLLIIVGVAVVLYVLLWLLFGRKK